MVSLAMVAGDGCLLLRKVRLKGFDVGCEKLEVANLDLLKQGRKEARLNIDGGVDNNVKKLRCIAEVR
jgi:hypothetical protein